MQHHAVTVAEWEGKEGKVLMFLICFPVSAAAILPIWRIFPAKRNKRKRISGRLHLARSSDLFQCICFVCQSCANAMAWSSRKPNNTVHSPVLGLVDDTGCSISSIAIIWETFKWGAELPRSQISSTEKLSIWCHSSYLEAAIIQELASSWNN